jgi:hypothetical protein
MTSIKLVLELGGEGGSVRFLEYEGAYYFTTNENYFDEKQYSSQSQLGGVFHKKMIELLKTYPVFKLVPTFVNESYIDMLKLYYDNFTVYCSDEDNWNKDDWERVFLVNNSK